MEDFYILLLLRAPKSMEMKMEENLSVIKRASKLLFGNINLCFFCFLSSLHLFCFLILFDLFLQTTVSITFQFISQQLNSVVYFDLQDQTDLSEIGLTPWLIKISILYFFPYTFLDLLTTTMIVAASSIVYMSEEEPLGLLSLVRRSLKICKNRIGGCLITSFYVLLLSTTVFFGFISDTTSYLLLTYPSSHLQIFHYLETALFNAALVLVHGTIFIVLTAKFSKWSAEWNMGLVVSVLEEDKDGEGVYGTDALFISGWYGKGQEKHDHWMMFMFFVFTLGMRMPCLYYKCNGVLYTCLYLSLICVGNMLKWVACVVSYHDCKTRVLRKKGDVEQAEALTT